MFLSYSCVLFVLTLKNYSEPDFPQSKSLILQKTGVWRTQGNEFQGLFKT